MARDGYHAVSMADMGAAAGITGPAIYRHFENKSAVLVELFDHVIDRLLADAQGVVAEANDLRQALLRLIGEHVEFVVVDRELALVYLNEIQNVPEEDRRRLRRKQRLYLEEWAHLVAELRPDLGDAEVRATIHAAIGTIQSTLFYKSGLPEARVRQLLTGYALAILEPASG